MKRLIAILVIAIGVWYGLEMLVDAEYSPYPAYFPRAMRDHTVGEAPPGGAGDQAVTDSTGAYATDANGDYVRGKTP